MHANESLSEFTDQSISVLTPDCIRSFIDNINTEDHSELSKTKLNQALKNIRNHIINTPNAINKDSLSNIFDILKEIFLSTSSELVYYKISEILFLNEFMFPHLNSHRLAEMTLSEFSNNSMFFNTLLLCIQNYYAKLAGLEEINQRDVGEEFGLSFYTTSIEILIKKTQYSYQQCKRFLLKNLESFKAIFFFYLQIPSVKEQMEKVFQLVLNLLKVFCNEPDLNSFTSAFILSLLSKITGAVDSYQGFSVTLVEFLLGVLNKENYNELSSLPSMFSEPLIVSLTNLKYQELWFKLWELTFNIVPKNELFEVLFQKLQKPLGRVYHLGLNIFLKRCEASYTDVITVLSNPMYIETILNKISSRISNTETVEIYSDTIERLVRFPLDEKIFRMVLDERFLASGICRKKFGKIIKGALDWGISSQVSDFFECLQTASSFHSVKFLAECLGEKSFKSITEKLLEQNLVEILLKALQQEYSDINKNELAELWKNFFSIFLLCENTKEVIDGKICLDLIKELRKAKYDDCRQNIIETCLEVLENIRKYRANNNARLVLISFEMVSYSYTSQQIEKFRSEIFKTLKLSTIGYCNIDLISSIIIYHLKAQHLNKLYTMLLKKCLICNSSPSNVVAFLRCTLENEATESILCFVKEILNSTKNSRKFWFFPGTGAEVYNCAVSVKLANKISICCQVYIGKITQDTVLFELQDDQGFNFSLKILNNRVEALIKCGKTEFPSAADSKLKPKSWNFIGASVLGGKNSIISLGINGAPTSKIFQDIKFSTRLKRFSVAGSLTNTKAFTGKISGLIVIKDFLQDTYFKSLNENPYFDIGEDINELKEKILFSLSPKLKLEIGNIEPETKVSYCFRGKSLAKNFKYANCVVHELMNKELSDEAVELLLDILNLLCGADKNSFSGLAQNLIIKIIIRPSLYPKYIKLISLLSFKVKKELLEYFVLNDVKISQVPQDCLKLLLKEYRKTFKFTTFNFLLLKNLTKSMNNSEISEHFSIFTEDLKDSNTTAEILATLAQAKDYALILCLVNMITSVEFKEHPENLFKVFMNFLIFPQLSRASACIYITIFSYFLTPNLEYFRNAFGKDSNKNRVQELNKYLSYIKTKAPSIEPVIDAVLYITSKGINFTEKSNILNLFDVVLSSVYSLNENTFHKFYEFLQYFVKHFNSAIIKSPHFPTCFIVLCKNFETKAGEVLIYIYSKIEKFKTFEKLVELFRSIKDQPFSFSIFASLFSTLLHNEFFFQRHLLAEVMTILSFFSINKSNSEAYCEIVSKFAGIIKENPRVLRFKFVSSEAEGSIDENSVGNIFCTIAFQVFHSKPSILFEHCKEIVMLPEVDFFTKLKMDQKDEDYSILFCFLKISNLIIKNFNFSEFLEKYREKTRVLERIEEFLINLSEEKANELTYSSISGIDLDMHQVFRKEKSLEFLKKCKSKNLSEIIKTEEWFSLVHIILYNFIVAPFEWLLSTAKEIRSNRTSLKKSRAGSLDCSSIFAVHGKFETFTLKLENLKHNIKILNKSHKFVPKAEANKNTFSVENYQDSLLRPSRIKLVTIPETENETRRRLYKSSIIRSRSTIDFSSILLAEQMNYSVLPEIKESLQKNEIFVNEFELIKIKGSYYGKLTIDNNLIQLKFEDFSKSSNKGGALDFTIRKKRSTTIISSSEISEVLTRKFIHRNTALEVFLLNGKSYFINFFQENSKVEALFSLKKWKTVHIIDDPTEILSVIRKKWIEGLLSNFHYLMLLNKYSGRSFKDLSQYPVFPWVIRNFSSQVLDLNSPDNFRNLAYPISAQTEYQRNELSKRYRSRDASTLDDYQHGSHYSNGGIVLYYLLRIEPYTQQAKILHDGSFDHPDRSFYSMQICWNTCLNMGDSKELVPEVFYSTEIFINDNNLKLGINTSGEDSGAFELPKWASNCWDFVRKHRKALESGLCSKELHKWIDLIFGYKQRGNLARESYNLYMKVTYDDIFSGGGSKSVQDNIEGIIDQIYHFGQTPKQIFFQAHPKRKILQTEDVFEKIANKTVFEFKVQIKQNIIGILGLAMNDDFLCVFYKGETEVLFLKYKTGKKISDNGKKVVLKWVNAKEAMKLKFCVWGIFIVSYGYSDYKIRIHDFSGEFITLINTSSVQPSGIICRSNLYYADFNTIISIKQSWKLRQKYYGHLELVTSISVSENYSILSSVSEEGVVLIHDLSTAEILKKFSTNLLTIHISEYGVLIGISSKGFSMLTTQGKLISFTPLTHIGAYFLNKTSEYLLYQSSSSLFCLDLFETQEKLSHPLPLSLLALSESNKYFACLTLESKELIIFS